jgi:hypothetical protein
VPQRSNRRSLGMTRDIDRIITELTAEIAGVYRPAGASRASWRR